MALTNHHYENEGHPYPHQVAIPVSNEYDYIEPPQASTGPYAPIYMELSDNNRTHMSDTRPKISGEGGMSKVTIPKPIFTISPRSCVIIVIIIVLITLVVGASITGVVTYAFTKTGEYRTLC